MSPAKNRGAESLVRQILTEVIRENSEKSQSCNPIHRQHPDVTPFPMGCIGRLLRSGCCRTCPWGLMIHANLLGRKPAAREPRQREFMCIAMRLNQKAPASHQGFAGDSEAKPTSY